MIVPHIRNAKVTMFVCCYAFLLKLLNQSIVMKFSLEIVGDRALFYCIVSVEALQTYYSRAKLRATTSKSQMFAINVNNNTNNPSAILGIQSVQKYQCRMQQTNESTSFR